MDCGAGPAVRHPWRMPATPAARRDPASGLGFVALGTFSAISPLCTDIYTPSLPDVMRELVTGPSAVQLTLTGFMVGLALGQLLIGSLSDAVGRRRLLLGGGVACVLATIGCALAPTIGIFIAARILQGLAGAAGVVLARAIIADSTTGPRTAKLLGLLAVIVGVAPVIAPLIGAGLAQLSGWRGVFWTIAAIMAAVTLLAAWRIPETLPPERRHPTGVRPVLHAMRTLLSRRGYLGYLLTFALAFGTFFSYVSASSFVLRVQHGYSAMGYGVFFAVCALAMTASAMLASSLAGRVPYRRMITLGVSGLLLAAVLLFVASRSGTPLVLFMAGCLVLTASMGQIMSNCTAMALSQARDLAGTGSALLGTAQFSMGAIVAPLVGLAGESDPRPFGIVVLCCGVLAAAAFVLIARPSAAGQESPEAGA